MTEPQTIEMNDDNQEPEEESRFVKLLTRSKQKIGKMKHIDAKVFAENFFFPIMVALYEEFDEELEGVYANIDNMDVDDAVTEALADSPEFIKEMLQYVMWVGATFDALFVSAGWVVQNPDNNKEMVFVENVPDEIKSTYQIIRVQNNAITNKLAELDKKIEEYAAVDDDGEFDEDANPNPSSGEGEADVEVSGNSETETASSDTPEAPAAEEVETPTVDDAEVETPTNDEVETPADDEVETPVVDDENETPTDEVVA